MTNVDDDYILRCPECLKVIGWIHITLPRRDLKKFVSDGVAHGLSVERMATEDARTAEWGHDAECSRRSKK